MDTEETVIYKPAHTPNQTWVKDLDPRQMDSTLSSFVAPKNDKRVITLCRPFAVIAKTSYSNPVTLPLGLAYVGGVLDKADYKTKIIDSTGEQNPVKIRRSNDNLYNIQGLTPDEILEKIDPNTFILGISLMFSAEWFAHRSLIEDIKKKYPKIIVIAGGEHSTAIPEYTLRDCESIDYIIKGEGEFSMLEFCHNMYHGKNVTKIPGICFIDKDKNFVDNGSSKRIEHIDQLPRPAWHLLKPENYFTNSFTIGLAKGKLRNMPILATRGCPYQCTFCSSPTMWTTRYIMRNPKDIVDEIEWLVKKYDANDFEFFDLTAIIKKSWMLAFCKELRDRKIGNITWQLPVGTRSEALDKETLQAIYDSGCAYICYAPESGSEKSLKIIKKRVKLDRLIDSIKAAVKIGHTVKLNFIIGFPHETLADCLKSIFFGIFCSFRFGIYDINFAMFSPYPGSELFEKLKKEKKIKVDDDYFKKLMAYMDVTQSHSYCENVSGRTISVLRFLGFSLSYIGIYISRPVRIYRLLKSFSQKEFFPSNLFEQRVYDFFTRITLNKKEKKLVINN